MPRVGLQVPMDRKTEGLLEDRVEETRLPIGPEGDEGESRRLLIDIEVGTTPVIVRDRIGTGQLDIITGKTTPRSEEHTSELQSRGHLVCRLLLEKKKKYSNP